MKRQLVVTAAVIEREDGAVLVAQRMPGKHMALKWEFPGGKVEWGEAPREGLKREIREELGIEIEVGDVLEAVAHVYEETQVVLLAYACRYLSGTVQKLDVHDIAWVQPEACEALDMPPADRPIVAKLLQRRA